MNYLKTVFVCLMLPVLAHGQLISTVAGCDSAGDSGNGGPAVLAALSGPRDVVADRRGNIYFVETDSCYLRKVNAAGIITTVAGTGFFGYNGDGIYATAAQLAGPTGVAVDHIGNVYIADNSNNRIRKVDTFGIITTVAGSGVRGYNGDGIPATTAQLYWPWAVALDSSSNIIISDAGNSMIRKVDHSGMISNVGGTGSAGFTGDGGPASAANISPNALAADNAGNVYFLDGRGTRARRIDALSGLITTITGVGSSGFSGDGGQATAAAIYSLTGGIWVDDTGTILIADEGNNRIRKIDTAHIITTIAGTGIGYYNGDGIAATSADLNNPTGVFADLAGKILIADISNHRIRCMGCPTTPASTVSLNPENRSFLKMYPNPALANGVVSLFVGSPGVGPATLEIITVAGRVLDTRALETNKEYSIQVPCPPGFYFLKAVTSEGVLMGSVLIQ